MATTDAHTHPRNLADPPAGRWGRTWLSAAALVIVVLVGLELFWRARGFRPSMVESGETWSIARARVGPRSVVLLGSSRVQADLDPRVLSRELGGREVVQLAILGSSPIPLLEELARDHSFQGVAIVGIVPMLVFDGGAVPERDTRAYMAAARRVAASPAQWIEVRLRARLQTLLVIRSRALSPRRLFHAARRGRWPVNPRGATRIDRFRALDFTLTDTERAEERAWKVLQRAHILRGERLRERLDRIERAVEAIEARGGRVVFLRLPRAGRVAELERTVTPREQYWDLLARRTRAATVHTDDYPTTADFDCPDGSHIDTRDSARFTVAVAALLRQQL